MSALYNAIIELKTDLDNSNFTSKLLTDNPRIGEPEIIAAFTLGILITEMQELAKAYPRDLAVQELLQRLQPGSMPTAG